MISPGRHLARYATVGIVLSLLVGGGAAVAQAPAVAQKAPTPPQPWHLQLAGRKNARLAVHSFTMPAFAEPIRYVAFRVTRPGALKKKRPPRRMLVLLHGLGGDPLSWLDLGRIVERLDGARARKQLPDCLVVLPAGGDGYWSDWVDGRHPYAGLVLRTMADAGRRYGFKGKAPDVALVGISMGGFGALSIGLQHANRFGFVAGLSATDLDIAVRSKRLRPVYKSVLGDPPRAAALASRNPYQLVLAGKGSRKQRFFLSHGSREAAKFRQGSIRLAKAMRQRKLSVFAHEVAGGRHGWASTWAQVHPLWIRELAAFWRKRLDRAATSP